MDKFSNVGKAVTIAIVAVIAVVIIVLIIAHGNGNANSAPAYTGTDISPSSTQLQTQTPQTSTVVTDTGQRKIATPILPSPPSLVIHIITPVKNDIWTIGIQNPISWDKAGNFSGSLSLIDAATKQFVGTIVPEVGPKQTSYTWNTRSVELSRTNPAGKDVVPGTYEIELTYDGNNIQPAFSPAFTITN